eukprot:3321789-Lingulodinium_polyedra.AAC.1
MLPRIPPACCHPPDKTCAIVAPNATVWASPSGHVMARNSGIGPGLRGRRGPYPRSRRTQSGGRLY